MDAPLLALDSITKRFGATTALDRVSLEVHAGECVGLLGENGAGKTTLVSVLFGLVRADAGAVRIDGRAVAIRSPRDARALGVGMVHQHFTLVPDLTVAENFALDEGGWALVRFDRRAAERRVREVGDALGIRVDPRARVADLSLGERQKAEILKALKGSVRVLVLDEPTATLTPAEAGELFAVVRRLRAAGRAVVFISHKLREVLGLTDRVVVLRRGSVVAGRRTEETSAAELAELMVGPRERAAATAAAALGAMRVVHIAAEPREPGEVLLDAKDIFVAGRARGRPAVAGATLAVRAREVVGVAGVDGNGQTELAQALAGLRPIFAGELVVAGRTQAGFTPRAAAQLGIAHVPADRMRAGLVAGLAVAENLVLKHFRRRDFGRGPFLDRRAVQRFAQQRITDFDVRPADPDALAGRLSGGNQQRVLLARELAFAPRLIVAESPTRGLDVQATEFVHAQLLRAARAGAGVLLLSTDLDEVLALADRLYVIYEGRLTETAARDPRELGLLMGGANAA